MHFILIDNIFIDFYSIIKYFIGLNPKLIPVALLVTLKPKPRYKLVKESEIENGLGGKSFKAIEKWSIYKEKKDSYDKAVYKIAEQGQK